MRAVEFIAEYKVDNVRGLGAVPDNQNVDYKGTRVMMRPSTFLKLALPLENPTSVDHIVNHIRQGGSLGAPFLVLKIPPEWENNNFKLPTKVVGHEGRNRMISVQKVEGDDPVEVHLFLGGDMRARHLTPEIIEHLKMGMRNQAGTSMINGPLFQ
jgi:hypothetical protein